MISKKYDLHRRAGQTHSPITSRVGSPGDSSPDAVMKIKLTKELYE